MKHATFIDPNIYEKRFESILNAKGIDYKKEGELDYIVGGRMIEVKGLHKNNWKILITHPQREYLMTNRGYVVILTSTLNRSRIINSFQIRRILATARMYTRKDGRVHYLLNVRWILSTFKLLDSYLNRWMNGI